MSPLAAVLWTLLVFAAIAAYAIVGEVADRAFQRRMDATLWKVFKPWKS
jgi:4-hydroxybenzoate polyprenyltransferase